MRGEVFRFKPGKERVGHEQQGRRFAIVVQARRFTHLSTWLVVPTSANARSVIYRPSIVVPGHGAGVAMCENLVSIDPEQRLADRLGNLSFAEMQEIDSALLLLLDLDLP